MAYEIQKLKPKTYHYSIKGRHFELAEHKFTMVQVLLPYFLHKERMLMVSESFTGKTPSFLEIARMLGSKKIAIITRWVVNSPYVVHPDRFDMTAEYDHVMCEADVSASFLRKLLTTMPESTHLAIYMDYSVVYDLKPPGCPYVPFDHINPNWHEFLLESVAANIGINKSYLEDDYSIVCLRPPVQAVDFIFASNDSLKLASLKLIELPRYSLVFRTRGRIEPLMNAVYTDRRHFDYKCVKLVMADIDLEIFERSLYRVSDITIIYTPEDFPLMKQLVLLCDQKHVPIPEHIRRLAYTSNTYA